MVWRRNRAFHLSAPRVMLKQYRGISHRALVPSNGVHCRTISTSSPRHGRGSDVRSSTMSRVGPSWTIGLSMYRSPTPSSTCSKRGSVTSSTSCSDCPDDLTRRHRHDRAATRRPLVARFDGAASRARQSPSRTRSARAKPIAPLAATSSSRPTWKLAPSPPTTADPSSSG